MPSRQLTYQHRRRAEGRCIICAERRDPESAHFCTVHLIESRCRALAKAREQFQPWRPGGPGRPPKAR